MSLPASLYPSSYRSSSRVSHPAPFYSLVKYACSPGPSSLYGKHPKHLTGIWHSLELSSRHAVGSHFTPYLSSSFLPQSAKPTSHPHKACSRPSLNWRLPWASLLPVPLNTRLRVTVHSKLVTRESFWLCVGLIVVALLFVALLTPHDRHRQ